MFPRSKDNEKAGYGKTVALHMKDNEKAGYGKTVALHMREAAIARL